MEIQTTHYTIGFGESYYVKLSEWINEQRYSKVVVLADTNTMALCVPYFLQQLAIETEIEVIEIPDGEDNKTIEICEQVWQTFLDYSIDRRALLINVGGGLVTDLGGFVAATYKRGIDFVNVPTTLLSMVDASVGGKTGVNLSQQKNMVGCFYTPQWVLIDVNFLDTLPANEMRSGLAEMLKHGLIADESHWKRLSDLSQLTTDDLQQLIFDSVAIKNAIVTRDPKENGERKKLNFGHTIGHAIESWSHQSDKQTPLLHGEAVAIGMLMEAYISTKKADLSNDDFLEIKKIIKNIFNPVVFDENDIEICISLLSNDKKNIGNLWQFTLLNKIGDAVINQSVDNERVREAFMQSWNEDNEF